MITIIIIIIMIMIRIMILILIMTLAAFIQLIVKEKFGEYWTLGVDLD